jgi:hypothetical protein
MGLQVASFEPDLFALFKVDWDETFFRYAKGGLGLVPCFSNLSKSGCDIRGLHFFIG